MSGQHLEPCQLCILAADGCQNWTLWWDRQHSSPARSGSYNSPVKRLEKETSKQRGLRQDFPAADRERESCEAQGVNVSQRTTGAK